MDINQNNEIANDKPVQVSIEEKVIAEFDNLDIVTSSAIAIMLSQTQERAASPYIEGLKMPDINRVLMAFLKDTYYAEDIKQIDSILNSGYLRKKAGKHFRSIISFVKGAVSDVLPKQDMRLLSRIAMASKQTNAYINKICETINTFEHVKYIYALSGNNNLSNTDKDYKLDHLSTNYKDALIYLADFLLTCICITKMVFVERMIKKISPDSEFAKIVENTANSLDSLNLIINKTKPIYDQYYQAELGYISGDELLYGVAITVMVNNIKKPEIKDIDLLKLDYVPKDANELNLNMRTWLDLLAKYDYATDIAAFIMQRTTRIIKNDYDLLLDALGRLLEWEQFYNSRVAYYKRERDKERYLKGDFNKELQELTKYKQLTD